MSQVTNRQSELPVRSFREQADEKSTSLFKELVDLLLTSKKWWLAPIVGALLIVGVMVLLGGTAAAPFIYTLF